MLLLNLLQLIRNVEAATGLVI